MALKVHKMVVGVAPAVQTFYFKAAAGTYTGLSTETGVDEASDTEQNNPCITVGELLRAGEAQRVTVSYTDGTKKKTGRLLVATSKLDGALKALKDGTAFKGGTITSARVARRLVFY